MKYKKQIRKAIDTTEEILQALNRIENEKTIDLQYKWQICKITMGIEELNRRIKKIHKIFKGITNNDML